MCSTTSRREKDINFTSFSIRIYLFRRTSETGYICEKRIYSIVPMETLYTYLRRYLGGLSAKAAITRLFSDNGKRLTIERKLLDIFSNLSNLQLRVNHSANNYFKAVYVSLRLSRQLYNTGLGSNIQLNQTTRFY